MYVETFGTHRKYFLYSKITHLELISVLHPILWHHMLAFVNVPSASHLNKKALISTLALVALTCVLGRVPRKHTRNVYYLAAVCKSLRSGWPIIGRDGTATAFFTESFQAPAPFFRKSIFYCNSEFSPI